MTGHLDWRGLLFFPVTPFGADGVDGLDRDCLAEHVTQGLRHRPGAVFVACGTGELHALSLAEHADAVAAVVEVVGGRAPVVAGAGGPLPHARACARQAAEAGADAVLLLPPYLVTGPPEGLVGYVHSVADASGLPVVAYQRGAARFSPTTALMLAAHPRVVGLKDGVGDLDLLQRIVSAVREAPGDGFMFFNGLPTAELTMPAYRGLGVDLYSSAVFAFLPEVATTFHQALSNDDRAVQQRLVAGVYRPFGDLRDQVPGYAVALVKAGVRLRGLDVGDVRPPLVDPSREHLAALQRIIDVGLGLVGA
ncbi:MAG: 5-dehydro-4-deoxyglucarate dehydratase [Acidimicrobiales bacterium]